MSRRKLTDNQRTAVFEAAKGLCHICKQPILIPKEKWDVEHIKPLWLDGLDAPVNWAPAHDHCHREKTAREAFERAHGKRAKAKHLGARERKPWRPKVPKGIGTKEAALRQMRERR